MTHTYSKVRLIFNVLAVLALLAALLALPAAPVQAATIPTFSIVNVEKDTSVTIKTHNFPANKDFVVRIGAIGTKGIGGTVVGTTNSGPGGTFTISYPIPEALAGSARLAIRMDATSGGWYSYNWFWNSPATPPSTPGYSGIPTFSIVSVEKDASVTIQTNNFPASKDFTVSIGAYGTKGVGGTVVATTNSGAGGVFTISYPIPEALAGSARLAIRMDAPGGFYAYNWFWNNPSTPPSAPGYSGIPTFKIVAVVKDATVVIKTNNLPTDKDFTVRIGKYGTLGIGGEVVAVTNSGAGGTFTISYPIPESLQGQARLSIRMDAPGGFYAYNWFWNSATP